jgi:hypothetical protein
VFADFSLFEDVDAIFDAVAISAFGHVSVVRRSEARKWCKADTMIDTKVCGAGGKGWVRMQDTHLVCLRILPYFHQLA